jgi:hypothetical protein
MRQADILADTGMAEQNFRDRWTTEESEFDPGRNKRILYTPYVQAGCEGHPAAYTMGTGAASRGIQRLQHEADYSPPSSTQAKNVAAISPLLHTSSSYDA